MKKLSSILSTSILLALMVGCNPSKPSSSTSSSSTSSSSHTPVTLTYAAWNLGAKDSETPNLERLMIQAFMQKYDWITVNIIERPKLPGEDTDQPWNEFLAARASVNKLPDVFFADNIPYYVTQHWAYDLKDIVAKDPEYQNLSDDIKNVATYSGKVMALPQAVHYFGYVVNTTLYEARNVDAPTIDSTYEEFMNLTKSAANQVTGQRGVAGLEGIEHILHWYPAQLNEDFSWWTFDGTKFNLNGPEFAEAMAKYRDLRTDKSFVWEALTGEEILEFFPEGWQWGNGNMLAKWYGSYDFASMQKEINDGNWTWNLEFIGTPVVNGQKRVPIVADFVTVSKTTKYPEEAYLLAKWMGFGNDGYAKRLELSNTVAGISKVNFAPLQANAELLDQYFAMYTEFQGLRKIIENKNFVVEPPKYLPGYIKARYDGSYDSENNMYQILDKLMKGEVQLADISNQLNNRANALYNEAYQVFYAELSKD
jgi:multiple sugar transport system substrate-binding protein